MHRFNRLVVTIVPLAAWLLEPPLVGVSWLPGYLWAPRYLHDRKLVSASDEDRLPKQWCVLYGDVPGTVVLSTLVRLPQTTRNGGGLTSRLSMAPGSSTVWCRPARDRPDHGDVDAVAERLLPLSRSLHGVKVVAGPSPVRIGGVKGTTVTVMTLRDAPLVWIKGDSAWLGGARPARPAEVRQIILLQVNRRKLLLGFPDVSPELLEPTAKGERPLEVDHLQQAATTGVDQAGGKPHLLPDDE